MDEKKAFDVVTGLKALKGADKDFYKPSQQTCQTNCGMNPDLNKCPSDIEMVKLL